MKFACVNEKRKKKSSGCLSCQSSKAKIVDLHGKIIFSSGLAETPFPN